MKRWLLIARATVGWLTLGVIGTLALLIMLVTPGAERRRAIGRVTSRIVLAAIGARLSIAAAGGLDAALPRRCVVIANHTSYLDGLILNAALPPRFAFVVKKEMSRVPLAGLLLRKMGCEFVDRFNRHRGAMDARRVLKRASGGQALVFFPEGTFSKVPGLLRFHAGAFVAAARARCPVVPIVIRGARRVLPYDRIVATPGTIEIELLPELTPRGDDPHSVAMLRDEARRQILAKLGEPDLATASHVAPVLPADLVERA